MLTEKLEGFGVDVAALLESIAADGTRVKIDDAVFKIELCMFTLLSVGDIYRRARGRRRRGLTRGENSARSLVITGISFQLTKLQTPLSLLAILEKEEIKKEKAIRL